MIAYILNLMDLACTLCAMSIGCMERNPLLQSIPVMVAYKVVIVGGLCWWLSTRQEPIARVGIILCAALYGGICIYHLYWIIIIWRWL